MLRLGGWASGLRSEVSWEGAGIQVDVLVLCQCLLMANHGAETKLVRKAEGQARHPTSYRRLVLGWGPGARSGSPAQH